MTNPYAPPRAVVQDVSAADAGLVLADRGSRLGAAILDSVIFMLMVYIPFVIPVVVSAAGGLAGPDDPAALSTAGAIGLIGLVAWCWLTFRYMIRNGQSIAKKMVGIKIVRSDGSPASLGRIIFLRNVVNWLISLIPAYGFIDSLFIFAESRQCLHDKLADTIVVKA
jgi:uncharacterized RDD family membrane protein YckC